MIRHTCILLQTTNSADLIHKFQLDNLEKAKRLWRLAVEHHAFFRYTMFVSALLTTIVRHVRVV